MAEETRAKAKVVNKKKRPLFSKKTLATSGALALLLAGATFIPVSEIPFLGGLPSRLGIPPEAMRNITLTDLAAYAVGVKDNRVSAAHQEYMLEESNLRGYTFGTNEAFPMAMLPGSVGEGGTNGSARLLDPRASYKQQYEDTGRRVRPIEGPLSKTQTMGGGSYYEGAAVAQLPGIPGAAKDAPIIDIVRAAPAGIAEYGADFGMPITAELPPPPVLPNVGQENITKPLAPFDIINVGHVNVQDRIIQDIVDSFKGGRLSAFGGQSALVSRMRSSAGSLGNVYAPYREVARSYFLSYSGAATPFNTTAKHLADAAYDGNNIQGDTLVIPGEGKAPTISSLAPPSTVMAKIKAAQSKCDAARVNFQMNTFQLGKDMWVEVLDKDEGMPSLCKGLSCDPNIGTPPGPGIPGICEYGTTGDTNVNILAKNRDEWNDRLKKLKDNCEKYKQDVEDYSKACGIIYHQYLDPSQNRCSYLTQRFTVGILPYANYSWLFGSSQQAYKNDCGHNTYNTEVAFSDGMIGAVKINLRQFQDAFTEIMQDAYLGIDWQ